MKAPRVRIAVVAMTVFGALVLGLGIAHVNRRQEVVRLGYELSRATDELSRLQEENRRLRLEKSALTSPERIRRLATTLGMGPPGPEQIRVITAPDDAPDDARPPIAHVSGLSSESSSGPSSESSSESSSGQLARTTPGASRRE